MRKCAGKRRENKKSGAFFADAATGRYIRAGKISLTADAEDAAGAVLRLKERKSDAEIAALSGAELSAYIEKMSREKAGK